MEAGAAAGFRRTQVSLTDPDEVRDLLGRMYGARLLADPTVAAAPLLIASGARLLAAGVSPRALQLAFRRHLNTTPLAYLRRIRLELAHRDLSSAVPGAHTTVTAVALRWGFASKSRFAREYRAAYGQLPDSTLRG